MRKLLLVALLATVATPALADENHPWGKHDRGARADSNEQRPVQAQPQQRAYIGRAPEAQVMVQPQQQQIVGYGQRGGWNRGAADESARTNARQVDPNQMQRFREWQAYRKGEQAPSGAQQYYGRQPYNGQRYVDQQGAQPGTGWNDHTRTYSGDRQGWSQPGYGRNTVHIGRSNGQRWNDDRNITYSGGRDAQRWTNNWRQDRRYDWRSYRDQNRSIFRIGNYYDPFGYGYQSLNVGFTLYSGYYQPNYWIDNPYEYRLPPVYGPYRWVRYYNDAVLVDIYSGEVEDVIRDFFW